MSVSIFGLSDPPETPYTGCQLIENADSKITERLYANEEIETAEISSNTVKNEYFILRNGSQSALARHDGSTGKIVRIVQKTGFGITPRNVEQVMALDMLLNFDIPLISITGRAGTGKTLLALAAALECSRAYHRILLSRPAVAMQDMGFLPGDVQDKLAPYMLPLYDNMNIIKHNIKCAAQKKRIEKMQEDEKIIIEPLAYIRGRSLHRAFMIVDEAQNLTPHDIKTIVTRTGAGTKIVFTGDIEQIDNPRLDDGSNGLSYLISRFKDQKLYAHITLKKGERSELAELAADLL